ncbi:MAG TPA: tetratricopeptide repeat protein [Terracidiphilus sp.]|nr:tetratricopeptide repeat protein [Terracidiphilus sp.]
MPLRTLSILLLTCGCHIALGQQPAHFTVNHLVKWLAPTSQTTTILRGIPEANALVEDNAYTYAYEDLRGDGTKELIVQATGTTWCGSAGCLTFVLDKRGADYLKIFSENLGDDLAIMNERVHGYAALRASFGDGMHMAPKVFVLDSPKSTSSEHSTSNQEEAQSNSTQGTTPLNGAGLRGVVDADNALRLNNSEKLRSLFENFSTKAFDAKVGQIAASTTERGTVNIDVLVHFNEEYISTIENTLRATATKNYNTPFDRYNIKGYTMSLRYLYKFKDITPDNLRFCFLRMDGYYCTESLYDPKTFLPVSTNHTHLGFLVWFPNTNAQPLVVQPEWVDKPEAQPAWVLQYIDDGKGFEFCPGWTVDTLTANDNSRDITTTLVAFDKCEKRFGLTLKAEQIPVTAKELRVHPLVMIGRDTVLMEFDTHFTGLLNGRQTARRTSYDIKSPEFTSFVNNVVHEPVSRAVTTPAATQTPSTMPIVDAPKQSDIDNREDGVKAGDSQSTIGFIDRCNAGETKVCAGLGSLFSLGDTIVDGRRVSKDFPRATFFYIKACDGGEPTGCFYLGEMYLHGEGVVKNTSKALTLFSRACEKDDMASCSELGVLYATGNSVALDYQAAARMFSKACVAGDASGCRNLGLCYLDGKGVNKDVYKGKELLKRSCSMRDQSACDKLKGLN